MAEKATSTANQTPWSGQQPYLSYGFGQAQNNYQISTPQYAPFQTWTDFSDQSLQGMGQIQGIANQSDLGFNAAQEANNTLTGGYLNNNPYLDQMTDQVAGDIGSQVNSAFASGGRYGSNAHADTLANAVGDASAGMRYQNYGDERTNMQRALALSGQVDQSQYNNANQLLNVGSMLEGKENQALQDDVNRWNFDQAQPDIQLQNYMDSIRGNYGGQTNTTSAVPTYGGSSMMGALGGGLSGAALGQEFAPSSWGNWGGALGGVGGALLGGLFS